MEFTWRIQIRISNLRISCWIDFLTKPDHDVWLIVPPIHEIWRSISSGSTIQICNQICWLTQFDPESFELHFNCSQNSNTLANEIPIELWSSKSDDCATQATIGFNETVSCLQIQERSRTIVCPKREAPNCLCALHRTVSLRPPICTNIQRPIPCS